MRVTLETWASNRWLEKLESDRADRGERLRPPKSSKTADFVDQIVDQSSAEAERARPRRNVASGAFLIPVVRKLASGAVVGIPVM